MVSTGRCSSLRFRFRPARVYRTPRSLFRTLFHSARRLPRAMESAEQILEAPKWGQSTKEREIELAYGGLAAGVKTTHLLDRVTYLAPVNFTEAAATARHRWFP